MINYGSTHLILSLVIPVSCYHKFLTVSSKTVCDCDQNLIGLLPFTGLDIKVLALPAPGQVILNFYLPKYKIIIWGVGKYMCYHGNYVSREIQTIN